MNLRQPFEFIPTSSRRHVFLIFLALTIAIFGVFRFVDMPLRTSAAPSGIVSFELAGSVEQASAMLQSWDAPARLDNAFGLGFDFLFMPVYAITLSLAVLLASARFAGFWPRLGLALGWGALAATVFDAFENIALLTILLNAPASPYPELAAACATIKFSLIVAGVIYALVGWLAGKHK
jgi:hypothetical protein